MTFVVNCIFIYLKEQPSWSLWLTPYIYSLVTSFLAVHQNHLSPFSCFILILFFLWQATATTLVEETTMGTSTTGGDVPDSSQFFSGKFSYKIFYCKLFHNCAITYNVQNSFFVYNANKQMPKKVELYAFWLWHYWSILGIADIYELKVIIAVHLGPIYLDSCISTLGTN